MNEEGSKTKRGYDLGKRLEAMDRSRRAVLEAARRQLESEGYRQMTMASLAAETGFTRQTIHNMFGSKRGVLEALFDRMALEGGMERMREVMHEEDPTAMLRAFVKVFCGFWRSNRVLLRRIHGIGAIDPDFEEILVARNQRRYDIALRFAKGSKDGRDGNIAALLTALTSFEFYDALMLYGRSDAEAEETIVELALAAIDVRGTPGARSGMSLS